MSDVDFSTTSAAALHARCVSDFFPRGIDEPPDWEFVEMFDEEIGDFVGGITTCLYFAKAATAELENRKRAN